MILEDCGVPPAVFVRLQKEAVGNVYSARHQLAAFSELLQGHGLGWNFHLWKTTKQLASLGLDLDNCDPQFRIPHSFLHSVIAYSTTHVLRDIKNRARIPVPDSWHLVGVADEGTEWKRRGYQNVRTLAAKEIYG